jgi:DNA-directed RNA polymerase subunit K/omega
MEHLTLEQLMAIAEDQYERVFTAAAIADQLRAEHAQETATIHDALTIVRHARAEIERRRSDGVSIGPPV